MAVDADFVTHRRRVSSGQGLVREQVYSPGNRTTPIIALAGMPFDIAMQGIPALRAKFGWALDPVCYNGPFQAGTSGGFVLTEVAAGAGNVFGVNVASELGGGLLIRTDNGDNDTEILQLTGAPYRYTPGKTFTFVIGWKTNDFDGEMHFGMNISDNSPVASLPSDGLFFTKAEAATVMTFHARKAGVSTTINVGPTIVNNTVIYYVISVSEFGRIDVWSGLSMTALALAGSVAAGNANIPNTSDLGLHLAVQTGQAASTLWTIKALAFSGDL
jgi:hypothetical protein